MIIKKVIDKIGAGSSIFLSVCCPVCHPAVGALLSTFGLGILVSERMVGIGVNIGLIMALLGLGISATRHRQLSALVLGTISSIGVYVAHNIYHESLLLYLSALGLIVGTIWNIRIERQAKSCGGGCERET